MNGVAAEKSEEENKIRTHKMMLPSLQLLLLLTTTTTVTATTTTTERHYLTRDKLTALYKLYT